jgi:hypothetical protein
MARPPAPLEQTARRDRDDSLGYSVGPGTGKDPGTDGEE